MSHPLTHDEFRSRVCGCCFTSKKNTTRNINENILCDIKTYQWPEYDLNNLALPIVICDACRRKIQKAKAKGSRGPITDFDYNLLNLPTPITRNSDRCKCFLCSCGRNTFANLYKPTSVNISPQPLKVCSECKSDIQKGVSHKCSKVSRNENICQLVRSLSEKSKEQILAQALREHKNQKGNSTLQLSTGGTPMTIKIGKDWETKMSFFFIC